ncbi:MAG: hypothetical protein ACI3YM_01835 [Prevotella sp.]
MEELKNEQEPEKKAPLSEEQMEEAAPSFLRWPQASKKKKHKNDNERTRKSVSRLTTNSRQRIQSNSPLQTGQKTFQPYWPSQNLDRYG